MKKRSFLFASGLALALLLTACGGKTTSSSSKSESQSKSDSAPSSVVSSSSDALSSSQPISSTQPSSNSQQSSAGPASTGGGPTSTGGPQSTNTSQNTSGSQSTSNSSGGSEQQAAYYALLNDKMIPLVEDNQYLAEGQLAQYRGVLGNVHKDDAVSILDNQKVPLGSNFGAEPGDNNVTTGSQGEYIIHNDAENAFVLVKLWEQNNWVNFYVSGYEAPVVVEPTYKVLGSMNEWSYDNGAAFVDDTDPESTTYVKQLKATFDVHAGDEFKVSDGENLYGYEILEEGSKGAFITDDAGHNNVKAKGDGQAELYFKKVNNEGQFSIYINFIPAHDYYVIFNSFNFLGVEVDEHPEENEDLVKQYRVELGNIAANTPITVANAFKEVLSSNFDMRRDDEANVDGEDGNYTIHNDATNAYALIYVWKSDFVNFYVSGRETSQVPANSWAEARAEIQEYFKDDNYQIPSFEVEGATSYAFNDTESSLTITFPAATDLDAKYEALVQTVAQLKIDEKSYHYSKYHDVYVNPKQNLILDMYMISEVEILVDFDVYNNILTTQGYGIVYIIDESGSYAFDAKIGTRVEDSNGYQQYKITNLQFKEGDQFFAYDFGEEKDFSVTIDSASMDSHPENYFEYDESEKVYVVKQDCTADVYVKLQWQNDCLYIG